MKTMKLEETETYQVYQELIQAQFETAVLSITKMFEHSYDENHKYAAIIVDTPSHNDLQQVWKKVKSTTHEIVLIKFANSGELGYEVRKPASLKELVEE
jgi:hypothetical protein